MKREYVIVSNRHQSRFPGCVLFWGYRTEDNEKRSFGGYTYGLDKCERYTLEESIAKIWNGEICDSKTIAGILAYKEYLTNKN